MNPPDTPAVGDTAVGDTAVGDTAVGDTAVGTAGFVDHPTHLLATSVGIPFPWHGTTVRAFHEQVFRDGLTPIDVAEPEVTEPADEVAARLHRGLACAAKAGLVEVSEMGMRNWWYLGVLDRISRRRPPPVRLRIYLASGLAERASLAELDPAEMTAAPRSGSRGPSSTRTAGSCRAPARCAADSPTRTAPASPSRTPRRSRAESSPSPLAAGGSRRTPSATGPPRPCSTLTTWSGGTTQGGRRRDAQDRAWQRAVGSTRRPDRGAGRGRLSPAVVPGDRRGAGAGRARGRPGGAGLPGAALAAAGVRLLVGTDYPIEVIEPLVGLARLVGERSDRPGFATSGIAPEHSRLPIDLAFRLATDATAGRTVLSADPRAIPAADLDQVEVRGTVPAPF